MGHLGSVGLRNAGSAEIAGNAENARSRKRWKTLSPGQIWWGEAPERFYSLGEVAGLFSPE